MDEIQNPKLRALHAQIVATSDDPEYQARIAAYRAAVEEPPQVLRERRYKAMHIPRLYWPNLHEDGRDTVSMQRMRDFAASSLAYALMAGDCGVGKTRAACWLLAQTGGDYVTEQEMVDAGYNEDFWRSLRLARLLVMDELCRAAFDAKGYALGRVHTLLVQRQADRRKTVLVTNLGLDVFKARFCPGGERDPMYDRLKNDGIVVTPADLAGPSLRAPPPHWQEKEDAS